MSGAPFRGFSAGGALLFVRVFVRIFVHRRGIPGAAYCLVSGVAV